MKTIGTIGPMVPNHEIRRDWHPLRAKLIADGYIVREYVDYDGVRRIEVIKHPAVVKVGEETNHQFSLMKEDEYGNFRSIHHG